MAKFTDNAGRDWTVEITVFDVKRVRNALDLDLYGLLDDEMQGLGKLLGDPCALVDLLYVLCADQAKARGVSDEDFGRSFGGDSLESATDAFLEAFKAFFQRPRVREAIGRVIETGRALQSRVLDLAERQLADVDLDSAVARLIASSGGSPGSSASTPAPSPSANST